MIKRIFLFGLAYFLPNLLTSCVNCGSTSKYFLESVASLEALDVSSLEERSLDRYQPFTGEGVSFGLNLKINTTSEQPIASVSTGYSCFACSLEPEFLASEISAISIVGSSEFHGMPKGKNLRELFVIDPMGFYVLPYSFRSIAEYEALRTYRSHEEIRFIFANSVTQNYQGTFTVTFVSDGKAFSASTNELVLKTVL